MRMRAYYYGFDATGCVCIDRILSSVACAGKAYHNTEDWTEDAEWSSEGMVGKNAADWIQNAANIASQEISTKNQALAEALGFLLELREEKGETYALTPNFALQPLIEKLEGLLEGGE